MVTQLVELKYNL